MFQRNGLQFSVHITAKSPVRSKLPYFLRVFLLAVLLLIRMLAKYPIYYIYIFTCAGCQNWQKDLACQPFLLSTLALDAGHPSDPSCRSWAPELASPPSPIEAAAAIICTWLMQWCIRGGSEPGSEWLHNLNWFRTWFSSLPRFESDCIGTELAAVVGLK